MAADDGLAELRAEIDAFYQGFGQPDSLMSAFRSAALIVPLDEDGRFYTSTFGELDWMCGFTRIEELARYLAARGKVAPTELRFHTVFGWRIVDDLAAGRDRPTGVVVDIAGASPMAFPPVIAGAVV